MGTARKLILIFSNFLLVISIVVFVGSYTVIGTIGNKEQTTKIIAESGLYSAIAQNARTQLVQSSTVVSQIPDTIVDTALSKAINEKLVQQLSEPVISSTYEWLNSTKESPEISLNLKPIQAEFTDSISTSLLAWAAKLPTCLPGQIPNTSDITNINCIPRGYSIKPEIAQIKKLIQNANTDTFNNNVTLENLSGGAQNQSSPIQTLKTVRHYYQTAKTARIAALIGAGISIILIVALSIPRVKSAKNLGIIFTVFGVIYTFTALLFPPATKTTIKTIAENVTDNTYKFPLEKILQELTAISSNYILKSGLFLLAVGIVLLVTYKLYAKNPTAQSISQDATKSNNN